MRGVKHPNYSHTLTKRSARFREWADKLKINTDCCDECGKKGALKVVCLKPLSQMTLISSEGKVLCQKCTIHCTRSKLSQIEVKNIKKLKKSGVSYNTLSQEYKVSPSTICDLVKGRTW
jgi:hypothetical protein